MLCEERGHLLVCVYRIPIETIQYCHSENVPRAILGSIFSKSVENFKNIRHKSFLEFYLVHFSVFFLIFLGQKLRKLQMADFEQIRNRFPF